MNRLDVDVAEILRNLHDDLHHRAAGPAAPCRPPGSGPKFRGSRAATGRPTSIRRAESRHNSHRPPTGPADSPARRAESVQRPGASAYRAGSASPRSFRRSEWRKAAWRSSPGSISKRLSPSRMPSREESCADRFCQYPSACTTTSRSWNRGFEVNSARRSATQPENQRGGSSHQDEKHNEGAQQFLIVAAHVRRVLDRQFLGPRRFFRHRRPNRTVIILNPNRPPKRRETK